DTTLLEVRLETGKTHQIRIHLAELGSPLVGERVYIRDYVRHRGAPIECQRLLLHAATLGFRHPTTGARIALESPLPPPFQPALRALRRGPSMPPPTAPRRSTSRAAAPRRRSR